MAIWEHINTPYRLYANGSPAGPEVIFSVEIFNFEKNLFLAKKYIENALENL